MKQLLTHFDIYDIFNFPENGDTCRFEKFSLSKKEFLSGEFLGDDSLIIRKLLVYFYIPINNEPTMNEIAELLDVLSQQVPSKELLWGCSSNDEIKHYEVFLVKTY